MFGESLREMGEKTGRTRSGMSDESRVQFGVDLVKSIEARTENGEVFVLGK